MKDLTHLTPMERMFVTGAITREEQLDKPGIHIDVLLGWIFCGIISWGGLYLAYHWIRWAIRGWL